MNINIRDIFPDFKINESIKSLDHGLLQSAIYGEEISDEEIDNKQELLTVLRIEASNLLGDTGLEQFLIDIGRTNIIDREDQQKLFLGWELLLDSSLEFDSDLDLEDVLHLVISGYYSRNLSRLKSCIESSKVEYAIHSELIESKNKSWEERVKITTTCALLYIVSQSNYDEIRKTQNIIDELADIQEEYEGEWLQNFNLTRTKKAAEAAALYHIAYAVKITSDYLLTGIAKDSSDENVDFLAYLNVILNRADNYLAISDNFELLSWSKLVGGILLLLHRNSIWFRVDTTGNYIKSFIEELTDSDREGNIFSLLPSQQDVLKDRLLDPSPVAKVLQMPTSGGKTLMAELAILQTFQIFGDKTNIIYVVPTRALANQIRIQLTQDFSKLGLNVVAVGSAFEEDPFEDEIIGENNGIFIATYEKADMLLRTKVKWFEKMNLMVIDEAHNVSDGERGARLELLLANLINQCRELKYLLLSPFMPGALSVAEWLSRDIDKSMVVQTEWKPSRLLMGLPYFNAEDGKRKGNYNIRWEEPHNPFVKHGSTVLMENVFKNALGGSKKEQVIQLNETFKKFGTVLCMNPGSKAGCLETAKKVARGSRLIKSPGENLKLAIEFAKMEYGEQSSLVECLKNGVALHHSSISPEMKFLIELAVKTSDIRFLSATTTVAQGMNFPISTVIMQSAFINQRRGGRYLSNNEFWNIAGRAGRVGLSSKGYMIFANSRPNDEKVFESYLNIAKEEIESPLLEVFTELSGDFSYESIRMLYREKVTLRPFIQYLAHALVVYGPEKVTERLQIILQSSLADKQISNAAIKRNVRSLADEYLNNIKSKINFVKTADSVGLSNFSLTRLRHEINDSKHLKHGTENILNTGAEGFAELIGALGHLDEFDFEMKISEATFRTDLAGELVEKWVNGAVPKDMVDKYPESHKLDYDGKVFHAAEYIYKKVSQLLSWGAHSYASTLKYTKEDGENENKNEFLPAYIQYGVSNPVSAIACQLGVPRDFAKGISEQFIAEYGDIDKNNASKILEFVKNTKKIDFEHIKQNSKLEGVSKELIERAYKKYLGL
ncbi:DEAD/DEAH box helicase [Kangiella shandongensis]|uniref:DEAD/DEAH box helicase n=1 Tax=Kangiella shandongensis TaxID=2763258 RepID=UPI001CBB1254|nr:DEAD/DEAH box helicase [Kangiella shandongensis]